MLKAICSALMMIATLLVAACSSESSQTDSDVQASAQPAKAPVATPATVPQELAPDVVRQMHWEQVFIVNDDGSVSPRVPISYHGISLGGSGVKFDRGVSFGGVDFASLQGRDLNAHVEGQVLVIDNFL